MSIQKRAPDRYRVQIRRRGYPHISKTFNSERLAQAFEKKALSQIAAGLPITFAADRRLMLAEAVQRFAAEVVSHYASYQSGLSLCRRLAGDTDLSQYSLGALDAPALTRYRNRRLDEGAAPQTVKHELGMVARIYDVAERDWGVELTCGNPARKVQMPKVPPGRSRRLVGAEETRLLQAAREYRSGTIEHIIVFAIETGMRRGEIARMQWRDIDFDTPSVHVPITKSGEPRDVPLSPVALAAIRAIPVDVTTPIFRMKANSITQAFERVCKRACITGLRFHDLRHEAVSRMVWTRGHLELARITGHSDFRTLLRYYNPTAAELSLSERHRAGKQSVRTNQVPQSLLAAPA